MRRLGIWITAVTLLAPLQACGTQYSAEAITAHVVDADTGKPLEGVIVVAHWELYGGLHPDRVGELTIMETVTDKNGRFHFPAWGPKAIPPGLPSNARLTHLDPEMLLFKSGYKFEVLANKLTTAALRGEGSPRRHSEWNNKTIRLEKFVGTVEGYIDHLSTLSINLGFARRSQDCAWKLVPQMLSALEIQKRVAKSNGASNAYNISPIDTVAGQEQCGSATDFFESYLK